MCIFFFQAEDGIRDHCVTGVQTCALPISLPGVRARPRQRGSPQLRAILQGWSTRPARSEERRVGKECRSRWWPYYEKKKKKEINLFATLRVANKWLEMRVGACISPVTIHV